MPDPTEPRADKDRPWPTVQTISELAEYGFWRACSGCHELNEGHPTGRYNPVLKCHVGLGCRECGGIGAIWDATDYADMVDFLSRDNPTDPHPVADDPSGIVQQMPEGRLRAECRYSTDSAMRHFSYVVMVPDPDGGYVEYEKDRATEADLRAEVERLRANVARADRAAPEGQVRGANRSDGGFSDPAPPPAAPTDNTALVEAKRIALKAISDMPGAGSLTEEGREDDWRFRAKLARKEALDAAQAHITLAFDAALASREAPPAAQEPVAWQGRYKTGEYAGLWLHKPAGRDHDFDFIPLYAAPPPACQQETRSEKNFRIGCPCGAKTTRNQARINGGLCHQCKQPLRALKGSDHG